MLGGHVRLEVLQKRSLFRLGEQPEGRGGHSGKSDPRRKVACYLGRFGWRLLPIPLKIGNILEDCLYT